MLDILENDDLIVFYKLPILDVAKCARISFPFQLLFWHFNIITLITSFDEHFESRFKRDQPFRSHPGCGQKKNFDPDPGRKTILTNSIQCFLQCFRSIFITHELWQYDIQQKSYTTAKIIISNKKVLVAVLLKKNFGPGPGPGPNFDQKNILIPVPS